MYFFFNDTATTEIYPLSLHDALPISAGSVPVARHSRAGFNGAGIYPGQRHESAAGGGAESAGGHRPDLVPGRLDRKSTRLNSSHSQISYAVFCLKKKKKL